MHNNSFLLYSRNAIAGTLSHLPKVLKRLTQTTTKLLPSWLVIAYLLPSRRMLALQYNAPMNHPGCQNAVSCCSLPWLLSASSPMQPNAFRLSSLAQFSSTSGELQVSMSSFRQPPPTRNQNVLRARGTTIRMTCSSNIEH